MTRKKGSAPAAATAAPVRISKPPSMDVRNSSSNIPTPAAAVITDLEPTAAAMAEPAAAVTADSTPAAAGFADKSAPVTVHEFGDKIPAVSIDSIRHSNSGVNANSSVFVERISIKAGNYGPEPSPLEKRNNVHDNAHQVFVKIPERNNKANPSGSASRTLGTSDSFSKSSDTDNKTWASLFANNRNPNKGMQLKFNEQAVGHCKIEANDLSRVEDTWGPTLIGYVSGRFPGRQAIQECCNSWAAKCTLMYHQSGWLVFKFKDMEDLNSVIENGPYYIFQRPLMLKAMPPLFRFEQQEITQMPVWVRLPSLPPDLWNAQSLGKILSNIGKPLRTDGITAAHDRISYARALVEVDVAGDLKTEVPIILPDDSTYLQRIVYEFVPPYCHSCNVIGHNEAVCGLKTRSKNRVVKPNAQKKAQVYREVQKQAPIVNEPRPNTHIHFQSGDESSDKEEQASKEEATKQAAIEPAATAATGTNAAAPEPSVAESSTANEEKSEPAAPAATGTDPAAPEPSVVDSSTAIDSENIVHSSGNIHDTTLDGDFDVQRRSNKRGKGKSKGIGGSDPPIKS